ncbi:MAG: hypothetical protein ABII96_10425 [Candidatus Zixiibacteriota bacterium]
MIIRGTVGGVNLFLLFLRSMHTHLPSRERRIHSSTASYHDLKVVAIDHGKKWFFYGNGQGVRYQQGYLFRPLLCPLPSRERKVVTLSCVLRSMHTHLPSRERKVISPSLDGRGQGEGEMNIHSILVTLSH